MNRMECELLRNGNDPKFCEMELRPICDWSHGHSVFTLFSCLIVSLSKGGKRVWVQGSAAHLSGQWGLLPSSQLLASEQNPWLYMFKTREERFSIRSSDAFASYCLKKEMEKKVASTASWWFGRELPREVWVLNHFLNLFFSVLTEEEVGNRWVTITSVGFPNPLREKCQVSSLEL